VGTGGKIAIGCGIAVLAAGVVAVVALGGLAFWAKGKAEEFTGEQNRIAELHRRANANRFTPPADGAISEDRLRTFLEVRKRVYAVYEKHKEELDEMGKKKQGDFGDVRRGFALINELRLAEAQALADLAMSEDEYRFLVEQIYKPPADVPPGNVTLLHKYEADIKRYARGGLEWIGL
jgi:hypothetical protein